MTNEKIDASTILLRYNQHPKITYCELLKQVQKDTHKIFQISNVSSSNIINSDQILRPLY